MLQRALTLLMLMTPIPALASTECSESCPAIDEVMVSFTDGNTVRCMCVKVGAPMNDDTAELDPANPPPPGPDGDQES